jgi:hypothetical protein
MATRIEESMRGLMAWLGLAAEDPTPTSPPSISLVPPSSSLVRPTISLVPPLPPVSLVPPAVASVPPAGSQVPPAGSQVAQTSECTRPPRRAGGFTSPRPRPPGPPWAA